MLYNELSILLGVSLACIFVLMFTFCTANIRITSPSFSVFFLEKAAKICRELE